MATTSRANMALPDPDEALDLIQGMQRARECYGNAPDPAFAVAIVNHAARGGLAARFIQTLDEEAQMVWVLEVSTARGTLELRPKFNQSWREYLGNDHLAAGLDLLPPDAPR